MRVLCLPIPMVAALDQRGAELGVREFTTTPAGLREALCWVEGFGALVDHVFAQQCTPVAE
jgi:hypothetical protein